MRKVDQEVAQSVLEWLPMWEGNDNVLVDREILCVQYRGNIIFRAIRREGEPDLVTIDTCGFHTKTTASRLKAIGSVYGFTVRIRQGIIWVILPDREVSLADGPFKAEMQHRSGL